MYVRTALTATTFAAVKAAAHAALIVAGVVDFDAPKVVATLSADGIRGLDDREQTQSRRRRWAMAYRTTCAIFDLPLGARVVPCYLCGRLYYAWTLDGEHVDPVAGSHPTNLALACNVPCNVGKHDDGRVHPSVVDRIYAAGMSLGYVLGGKGLKSMWQADTRRRDGRDPSRLWEG